MGQLVRLQKILARAGFGSRRACEKFIVEGRVQVDGAVVHELGAKADPEAQTVVFDGQKVAGPGMAAKSVRLETQRVYYMLNKPRGVLCTNDDPSGRPLAVNLVPERRRIFCVGRLDMDSEGLIVLTNDGELAHRLTHPRYAVPKTYVARVDGKVTGAHLERIQRGVRLAEGRTQGADARIRKRGMNGSVLQIVVREGLNREVRRMLAAVGLRCRRLKRVRLGPLVLGQLPVGASRELARDEVHALERAGTVATPPPAWLRREHHEHPDPWRKADRGEHERAGGRGEGSRDGKQRDGGARRGFRERTQQRDDRRGGKGCREERGQRLGRGERQDRSGQQHERRGKGGEARAVREDRRGRKRPFPKEQQDRRGMNQGRAGAQQDQQRPPRPFGAHPRQRLREREHDRESAGVARNVRPAGKKFRRGKPKDGRARP